MASFAKSLLSNSATTDTSTTSSAVALASIDETEIFVNDTSKYIWYDEYSDSDYSVIDENKNITVNEKQINLTQEINSQFVPFVMPRRYDNVDLSTMTILIHYVNKDGNEDIVSPVNVSYSETKIKFAWLLSKTVTAISGEVKFEIQAIGTTSKGDEYLFRTKPNGKFNILESLSGNGVIEPTEGWDVYIDTITQKVAQAQAAADSAQTSADLAAEALTEVDTKIENVSDEIRDNVLEDLEVILEQYYTADEIDAIIKNLDYSNVLNEVQEKIDAIDGLANLVVEYDSTTNVMTFKNGDTEIVSHTLNTNPTAEWTATFRTSMKEDIDNAVKVVADDLTLYKETNDKKVEANTSAIENMYTKTEVDVLLDTKAEDSDVATLRTNISKVESSASANSSNITTLSKKIVELEETMSTFNTDPSLEYDVDYNAESGVFKFIEIEDDTETVKRQFTITGGSGSGTTTTTTVKIERITTTPVTVTNDDDVIIKYSFSSIDSAGDVTDAGTATWKVGSTVVATSVALQGENEFDLTDYVSVGSQKITLSIVDSAGTIAIKTWTVQVVDVRIESSFNDKYTYPIEDLSFSYTPYGSISKDVHFILDGEEIGIVTTSSSGIPMSFTIPAQEHGSHLLEAYITATVNNVRIETNHIYKDILWFDETSDVSVIGCTTTDITALQYDSTNIVYTVYDPKTENPKVTLSVDGEVVSTLTLESATQTWQYKSSDVGSHILTIACGETIKTINVEIIELDIDVEPVTANLAFDFNPVGYSNNDEVRLWTDGTTSMTVSDNFDWINGGYQIDENGDQYFCIKAGTSAEIDYKLFEDDAKKTGKEFKLVFKTTNVQNIEAKFLDCMDNTTGSDHIGIEMLAHEAHIYGASTDHLVLPYSEDDIIEFEFNISNNTESVPMIMGYEDGVSTRPLVYDDSYNFTQNTAKTIRLGSEYCDLHIYRFKVYKSSLSARDILNNFIADAQSAEEMINRYERNQIYNENGQLDPDVLAEKCPQLRIIKIEAPYFTNNKSDKVPNTIIECIYKNGDPILDNWKAYDCLHSGQGTSSNNYGAAGRNLDLIMKSNIDFGNSPYIILGDGTQTDKVSLTRESIPVNYFNVKVNIASSNNLTNALLAKKYNDYNPYTRPFVREDETEIPKIKDTMEFQNCVVFIKETNTDLSTHREFADNEWHFYAIGNVGDSKKTDKTRLTDPNDPYECCVEIMDVELPLSDFPSGDEAIATLEADNFDEKGTYGWRYISDEDNAEIVNHCKQKWIEFYKFVVNSSDTDFKASLKDYFVVDSALYYYLFTTRYTMADNRAKNSFWHYGKTGEVDSDGNPIRKWNLTWGYDMDTALGLNNYGAMVYRYGLEDTDVDENGEEIFRESDSTFFCRLRDLFVDELKTMYNTLESQNAWHSESFIAQGDEWQSQFPEELWRLDIERKYIRTYNSSFINGAGDSQFLVNMANGKMKYQRRQWERDQEKYMASKYQSSIASSDNAVLRCTVPIGDLAVPTDYKLKLTPYSYMYLNVKYGTQEPIQLRAEPNIVYEIPYTGNSADIIDVYSASCIKSLGDLSTCYPATVDTSKATKLKELKIGNDTEGYDNPSLTTLTLGANYLLETLNIENVSGLTQSLNMSVLNNLRELYAHGSNVGGVIFANGGNIEIAELPAINAITMKNLLYLTTLNIASFDKLTSLTVENCSTVDLVTILETATNLNRVRILGIDWTLEDTTLLERLYNMYGMDSYGYNTTQSVLTGSIHVPVIRERQLYLYQQVWSDLTITYDSIITQFAVTFQNYDGTVLDVQYVDKGGSAVDPTTRTDNPIVIPTKPSTVSIDYTFSGWDLGFDNIFAVRTITAQYTESVRNYTVTYTAKGTVLKEIIAPYGSIVEYDGDIPTYTSEESAYVFYLFEGWDASGYVDGDKTINATYSKLEYVEGCLDGIDISEMTPVQIYAMTQLGLTQNYVELKDSITFNMGGDYNYSDIQSQEIISEKTIFAGSTYLDTGLTLLKEDKDWVIAIDYEWMEGNQNGSTLVQCYQGDGSNGFKINYSSYPKITWGTASISSANVDNRDMVVLRHIKGETQIHVYKGNLPADVIDYSTLSATRCTTEKSTLVFGCEKADDGSYEDFAYGAIYWCKVWYADLGDTACRKLAEWTHESINLEACSFKSYYLSDGSGKRSSISFLASHILENTMAFNGSTSNTGGWAEASLNRFLNNRFYEAIPDQWKQLIKQVKISSTVGGKSSEISTSNCYITIPSVAEIDTSMYYEPYSLEGEPISYLVSYESRMREFSDGTSSGYFTRSPNASYDTYIYTISDTGYTEGYRYGSYANGVLIMLSI